MADIINGKAITAMKVAELQQELQRRGMNRNGRKSELVERLRKSIEGKEDTVDQALSGEDTVHTSKEEASPISADDAMIGTDEALLSTEEALATTEEEIHPDSTCTMEIASECMQPQVSSSTGEGGQKGGSSVVEGPERMDGDGVLEVHLVGKDLQEFADEGAGNERDHQKESPMAKRRKLNVAGSQSAGGGAKRKSSMSATPTSPGLGEGRGSLAAPKDTREAESDMEVSLPLGGKEADSTPGSMMPTGPLADGGGGLRRSISAEVDEEYEKLRKEKERERESLRHKIELQKKEQARAEAREAEERRVLRAKELEENQAKETEQQQPSHNTASSADEKSQRMEAKKHREELRRSMEEVRERRRSEARNRLPVEEKLELAPPRGDPSHVLHIQHLTRPFTNQQLMELLGEEGSLVERAFWTDKRKSYCYAAFRSADEARVVAKRLHGLKWPSHNKRPLEVEFVSIEAARKGSNGSFEAPGVSQPRDETPPLEELEGGVGVCREEQVPQQVAQLPQAVEEPPVEMKQNAEEVHPPPPPVQTAPPPQEDEGNTLDKLFRKTVTKPHIYWLPLTEDQAQLMGDRQREKDREARQREREAQDREVPRSRDRCVSSRQQDRR